MKCRWVRQAIHAELDSIREGCAARGESVPVDFEVVISRLNSHDPMGG